MKMSGNSKAQPFSETGPKNWKMKYVETVATTVAHKFMNKKPLPNHRFDN